MSATNSTDSDLIEPQRFRLLVNSIRDYAIYMLDPGGHVVSWNSGAERFKGYVEREIIGQHFSVFYSPEDRAAGMPQRALYTAEHAGSFEAEGWRVRKDGTRFQAHVVIDPIKDEAGRLLGFAKITRDITERKQAEEALRASEQQFRLLVQGVTDYAIFMLDPSGMVSNWNPGAQRIKGYTQEEIVGSHFSRFYTPEDRATGLPARALATASRAGRFEQEGWRVRKDGSRFMAHVVIDPIRNSPGELVGFAKVTRDISERVAAAAALKRTEQALQQAQKMEAIGKLTGGVAHDFNNLLQILSGNLQLLSRDVVGNERAEHRVQKSLGAVVRGAKLASYLLAFGRRQALDPKVVNIGRYISGMEDMLQRTLGEDIVVELVVAGGLWNTLVDVSQVENAVLNLSLNARDAMDGAGRLTIEIGNAFLDDAYVSRYADVNAGQYVVLAITDTGSGMPPEVAAHAFEPFFSTKPEGQGTGLGLSMVYGFVKQSGGHVEIYSEQGHGTTIKVYLPRSVEDESALQPTDTRVVVGGSETILVAEDDPEVSAVAVELLTELGYHVLKAQDAAGALAIIASGLHIDLLFTDVVMPGPVHSPELARRAKEMLPKLAVLFTSGYTQNAIVHGGHLDPGVDLLTKPYTREELGLKVRQVLANQTRRQGDGAGKAAQPAVLLKQTKSLKVVLVEGDNLTGAVMVEMLGLLGHVVTQAKDARQALELLEAETFDVLIADIAKEGISGEVLALNARELQPSVGIVFTSGNLASLEIARAVELRKPYSVATISKALRSVIIG